VKNPLEHLFADPLAAHDELEHIVVTDGQLFPRLDPIPLIRSPLFSILRIFAGECKKNTQINNL
jgi:hypothetical protein